MNKSLFHFVLTMLVILTFSTAYGQESVGFSDAENIQPLLDYRLPDWGYSNFWLDLDHGSSLSDQKFGQNAKSTSFQQNISLSPRYNLYRESESRVFTLSSALNLGYERSSMKNQSSNDVAKNPQNRLDTDLQTDFSLKKYLSAKVFLLGGGNFSIQYLRDYEENRENGTFVSDITMYERNINLNPRIGIGFGRIRNVNPVIRSVRLDERMRTLNQNTSLGQNQILNAAEQFTKYQGYQARYDRPEKHFWQDMNQATGSVLSGMDPYDLMYLTDVLDEAIGSRLEGWEVTVGGIFNYNGQLDRTEENTQGQAGTSLDRSFTVNKNLTGFVNARWYKNLTLNHQIGVFGSVNQSHPLEDDSESSVNYKRSASARAGVNWLWSVADRWLIVTTLLNDYMRRKRTLNQQVGDPADLINWTNRIILSSDVNYFIENQLSLTVGLNGQLRHNGNNQDESILDSRNFASSLTVGLRYYFSRNLY